MTADIVPLATAERARRNTKRGAGKQKGGSTPPSETPPSRPEDDCPITALGHIDGMFVFLSAKGEQRKLSARQLGTRADLSALFVGHTEWLLLHFPKRVTRDQQQPDGGIVQVTETVGFQTSQAGEWLMRQAGRAGFFGDHVVIRRGGIWTDAAGSPAVHCGDVVILGGETHPAGQVLAGQVWAAGHPTLRPADSCLAAIGQGLVQRMQELWCFRRPGAAHLVLGLIGSAYYGAAPSWRSNGFLIGGAGCGKSKLLAVMRALSPLHHYTNDTSKAGLEQVLGGRAMPSFVDEAGDKVDQRAAQVLMDVVLSSTGGEGTKGHRGGQSGIGRVIELVGAIIMACVTPPDMQPQHYARFTLIELAKPEAGDDNTAAMDALAAHARTVAPALWGRALAGWQRYQAALTAFRAALGRAGCAAREMDQMGALLAGWWVLTEDGVPNDRQALSGVVLATEFIRRADEIVDDDNPRRALQHLLSCIVQLDRSTDVAQIGELVARAIEAKWDDNPEHAQRVLARNGIRVIRRDEKPDARGRPAPRMGDGAGMWLARQAEPMKRLYRGSPFEGDRWAYEVRRLETARESSRNIRVGGVSGRAIWVGQADFDLDLIEPEQ